MKFFHHRNNKAQGHRCSRPERGHLAHRKALDSNTPCARIAPTMNAPDRSDLSVLAAAPDVGARITSKTTITTKG